MQSDIYTTDKYNMFIFKLVLVQKKITWNSILAAYQKSTVHYI